MYAAHHRLGRLTVMVDLNGQQALGKTAEVLSLAPMVDRWRAFGWNAAEIDGHDVAGMAKAFAAPTQADAAPRVFVARTTFGKGVSYMENQLKWHYWPMSDDEYRQAMTELDAG